MDEDVLVIFPVMSTVTGRSGNWLAERHMRFVRCPVAGDHIELAAKRLPPARVRLVVHTPGGMQRMASAKVYLQTCRTGDPDMLDDIEAACWGWTRRQADG